MGFSKTLRVNSKSVCIDSECARKTPGGLSEKAATKETAAIAKQIRALQLKLYAENRQSLLIVLQGLDAAGKDGAINHVLGMMNPQGCRVVSFKQPTALEARHDFLWRVHPHVPPKGEVAIFNRSHYEDVLVARVHQLCPLPQLDARYEQINQFESLLTTQANTRVIKLFLHISREEQLARFAVRLDDPAKNWKISGADYTERQHWDAYREAYEKVLSKTSKPAAPWYVIPSDNKWYRNYAVAKIVLETLLEMQPAFPPPSVNIGQVREEFHNAVLQEVRLGRVQELATAMDRVIESRDEQLKLAGVTLEEIKEIDRQARKAKKTVKKPRGKSEKP